MSKERCFILGPALGKDLTEEECTLFVGLGTIRDLADGEMLIKEGEVDNSLYVVVSGNLAVTRQVAGGELSTLHVLHAGELAGELGFIDGLEHSASLCAIGPVSVFTLSRDSFEPLLSTNPHLVFNIMRAIIRGVHTTLRRMNEQQVEMSNYISKQHGRY
jgi:CRP/FNR family cyclic AMP-dependent transcriptional regulator